MQAPTPGPLTHATGSTPSTPSTNAAQPAAAGAATSPAWWRVRLMWFVVGGPLAVVVASFTTLALAILNPDPVLVAEPGVSASERPAVEMRNHAATAEAPSAKR